MQYPTLIYDGAFSDARHLGEPKGLPEGTVTQDEAIAIARAFVGEDRVIPPSAPGHQRRAACLGRYGDDGGPSTQPRDHHPGREGSVDDARIRRLCPDAG